MRTENEPNGVHSSATSRFSIAILLVAFIFLSTPFSADNQKDDKQLSVYSPVAVYSLPVLERSGHDYVGLLELLDPLGRVSSATRGQVLKLRYNAVDAEFVAGRTRARVHGRNFGFTAPVIMENFRALVPLDSINALLPLFLGSPVDFRENSRRLFVGYVAIQISFKIEASDPPSLALNFTAPVNPTISTEAGKLRLLFKRDPVVSPVSQSISFNNKVITQATYSESNGAAELDVMANAPLMASFSPDRRTIKVAAIPQKPVIAAQNPVPSAQTANRMPDNRSVNTNTDISNNVTPPHRPLIVVEPAHGGDERGAALTDTLAEKDVALGFARLLRHELEVRGFAVTMLREADIALTSDQRAAAANTAHAALYISLHAASEGSGVRVYTALLPVEGPSAGIFHAWNAAQAPILPLSRMVAMALEAEFRKRQTPVQSLSASLRPLNNVVIPAVAVELAPGPNGILDLASANYQQRAAAAIADAVVSVRDRLEGQSAPQLGAQP